MDTLLIICAATLVVGYYFGKKNGEGCSEPAIAMLFTMGPAIAIVLVLLVGYFLGSRPATEMCEVYGKDDVQRTMPYKVACSKLQK